MEEAEQNRFSMNLADRRLQLQRYRSRWDNIDQACWEDIAIRPFDVRICEKGYLAYAFRNASGTAHCFQVIRLPSTCGGVTRGEWVLDIDVSSPDAAVLGMTLQPELDLLVIVESFQQRMYALPLAFVAVNLTDRHQDVADPHNTTIRRPTTPFLPQIRGPLPQPIVQFP